MHQVRSYVLSFILSLSPLPFSADNGNPPISGIEEKIEHALHSRNAEGMLQAVSRLQEWLQSQEKQHTDYRKYAYYYLGYACYRLSNSFPSVSNDKQNEYLSRAIRYLEQAAGMDPSFAEAQALLAGSYGLKARGFLSRIRYGIKFSRSIQHALNLAPENPRVVLIDGIGTLHKPPVMGGGTEPAIHVLRRATVLFESWNPPYPRSPDWGHEEAYAWLGKAYLKNKDYDLARQAYQTALKLRPGYYWVTEELLPELNELENGGSE